ncbi:sulfite exporter TauE/SafE family protein [Achromobacter sp. F4_2707]|uniref:sulfite exporter TauE/SafE family protein n=1 Tax=Achromobacter sp. F4_2707 TaxID=3114286 RepID=UPI0039C6CFC6
MSFFYLGSLMLLGAFGGFAAGLLGIGGGMILVPFMIMLFPLVGLPQDLMVHTAIATSMSTILFTSISSMRAHHRKGAIRWDIVAMLVPGIIVGGLLSGGAVFSFIDPAWLALVFSGFVAYSGARMMWGKPPAAERSMPGKVGTSAMGVVIGFVSGLVGAGGGFLSVPFMVRGNVPIHNAVASSAALGFFIALANSVGYVVSGQSIDTGVPGMFGYIHVPTLLGIVVVSMLMAPVGAKCAHSLPVATLKRVFAFLLFALALYMLFRAVNAFGA